MSCCEKFLVPFSVERPTRVADGAGGYLTEPTWDVIIPVVWCSFMEKSGGEHYAQETLQVRAACEMITWFRQDILETDRMVGQGGEKYNIRRVSDLDQSKATIKITTELGVWD